MKVLYINLVRINSKNCLMSYKKSFNTKSVKIYTNSETKHLF